MKFPFRLPDGIRTRMAAALLAALLAQFVGSEIIFERIESARMERGRAQRLADWLSFADEFAGTRPGAVGRMTALWEPHLSVTRVVGPPPHRATPATARDARIEQLVITARPELKPREFRAMRDGAHLTGSMRLSDGGWLAFRAADYFHNGRSQLSHYASSILLLLICVVLLALLFGRMIARPLARIAGAAERVGREDSVPIPAEGPREVRQVAAAFERMQARLLTHVSERVQSLAAISHDLRTPLARLRLNASTVEDADTRAVLQADVTEMEGFVASILDYLRGDEAEPEQRADVASILLTVVDEARDRGEAVDYTGPDRWELATRPLKLKRLVRNIVQNAVRHGGNARVTLETAPSGIAIVVDDDGPGIPEDRMEDAFRPFTRIDPSRNQRTGGVGLGLAIARRLAERLGGTIVLRNRAGGGLSVRVTLPGDARSGGQSQR